MPRHKCPLRGTAVRLGMNVREDILQGGGGGGGSHGYDTGNNCIHVHDYVSVHIIIRSNFRYGTRGIAFVITLEWN